MNTTAGYRVTPELAELELQQRDFRFFPVNTVTPRILTAQQIAQFNQQGYVMPFRIFSEAEIIEIRQYFDRLLTTYLAEGHDSYSISTAHLKHGRVWDILTNSKIVALVQDLLGPNVIGWGSHFFCKMPNDGKSVAWHQDSSYWPLTPSKAITVWLAIDDADPVNANMRYIPGTHLLGHLTWQLSETDEANVLNQKVPGAENLGEPVDVCLKAGEASIHSDLLLHGSEANQSNRRRCGLTLRYTPTDVQAYLDWDKKGVVVAGEPANHWSNQPRPLEE